MQLKDKRILVIGGTGTIGKSIVQHLLKEMPKLIRIFSRDEFKQQQMKSELRNNDELKFIIGDVREYDSLYTAMQDIDYVLHLAAMKQVDTCEDNPLQAVRTNIEGTKNVINAAQRQNVKKVVFTSSDKAISPTNTYGATKLIAEKMISSAQRNKGEGKTVFATVRFGNVMGSRGSVIPLFKDRIIKDRKITITDMNMTRFMMTLNQATTLTIKALKQAKGGEVFVLKMPVIKLGDLTEVLMQEICQKNGINPADVEIEIIGIRPGEKEYEELMTFEESKAAWELPDMYVIQGDANMKKLYGEGRKARVGSYSSMNQKPLTRENLRKLLQEAGLLS